MSKHSSIIIAGLVCVGTAVPATLGAQEAESGETDLAAEAPLGAPDAERGYRYAEDLVDLQVFNAVGAEVGEISQLIIREDRVTHAIISIGGFVGLGGTDVVVPFDVLRIEGERVTIDTLASADQIEQLTLFDPEAFGLPE